MGGGLGQPGVEGDQTGLVLGGDGEVRRIVRGNVVPHAPHRAKERVGGPDVRDLRPDQRGEGGCGVGLGELTCAFSCWLQATDDRVPSSRSLAGVSSGSRALDLEGRFSGGW